MKTSWPRLLEQATRLVMDSPSLDYVREGLPEEAVAARRLTEPGATEEELAALEARLGVPLPPSYRDFLRTTNGMLHFPGVARLRRAAEVDWFRVVNEEWCEIFEEHLSGWATVPMSRSYPNDNWPALHARELLQINDTIDGDTVCLNPAVCGADGEWEAYAFYSHDSVCYRSFAQLMQAKLDVAEQFHRIEPHNPFAHLKPLAPLTISARMGESVKREIEQLYREGLVEAAVSLAEIEAFEGNWRSCFDYAVAAIENGPESVARQLRMHLLACRAAQELGNWDETTALLKLLPQRSPVDNAYAEEWWERVRGVREFLLSRGESGLTWMEHRWGNYPGGKSADGEERRRGLDAFCEKQRRETPRNFKTPERAARYRFTFAIDYRLPEEAMRLAAEHPEANFSDDDFAIARQFAEAGDPERAWEAVLLSLRYWNEGGDPLGQASRVAPVELLIDPVLRKLMTMERGLEVLRTPRPRRLVE